MALTRMFKNDYFSKDLLLFFMLAYFDMIYKSIDFFLSFGSSQYVFILSVKNKLEITSNSTTPR